jgi:hypothetical protein
MKYNCKMAPESRKMLPKTQIRDVDKEKSESTCSFYFCLEEFN